MTARRAEPARHVLAAIDDSAATGPVVAIARWFASLLGADARALHVTQNGSGETARGVAEAAGVPFERRRGEPVAVVCDVASRDDIGTLVIGTRALPAHRVPAGHVALDVIRNVVKPVMVVPPEARIPREGALFALAPVDEKLASSAAVRRFLAEVHPRKLKLVLLRVFDLAHIPRFANHAMYEHDIFVDEFIRRTLPGDAARPEVTTRVGHPAHAVLAVERETKADVVVLGWGRELSGERASVVKRLLAESGTPLLLLPARDASAATPAHALSPGA